MNILFVTGVFAHNNRDQALGGMERAVFKSAFGMMKLGHNVRILTADSIDRSWKYQGIEVKSFKAINIFDCVSDITLLVGLIDREINFQKEIALINKNWKIDIIQYTGWYGVGLFHYSRIPAIMRVSSYTNLQFADDFSKRRAGIYSKLECMAVRRMDSVFAPSYLMAEKLGREAGKNIEVIETPYMSEAVEEDNVVFNEWIGRRKYVLYFGRLSIDKGIYTIRDTLYEILDRYRNITFVFVGNGTINNGIRIETELYNAAKEYSDRIICLGKLDKSKLIPIIKNAEFIVLPSLHDNLPNTCVEAMAYGKIVIGTNGSSMEQLITNAYNGLLAQPDDSNSLFEKIVQAIELDKESKFEIEQNAKDKIKELDINTYSKKMQNKYQKIIELKR